MLDLSSPCLRMIFLHMLYNFINSTTGIAQMSTGNLDDNSMHTQFDNHIVRRHSRRRATADNLLHSFACSVVG